MQHYHHALHCSASGLNNAPPNFKCSEVLAALAALLRQLLTLEVVIPNPSPSPNANAAADADPDPQP